MGIAVELELPPAERREWLLDGLSRLVAVRGYEKFVAGPVLLPTDEHFPDVVEPGPHGARTLLRRLGAYAGLEELGVRLRVFERAEHHEFDQRGIGHGGAGAAAWFAGIHAGVCEYGVERRELHDPEELIGTLGHEVSHAYRHFHALVVPTRETEEKLTDLTAVYLGFGVFLLNSSHSFKTGHYSATGERMLWETKVRGYLSPPELSLLLAAQVVTRGSDPEERNAVKRALAPNHAKLFDDACRLFETEPFDLGRRLGIPETASRARGKPAVPEPLRADDTRDAVIDVPESPGKPASRAVLVKRDRGFAYAVLGAAGPILFAATGVVEGSLLLAIVAGGAASGFAIGKLSRDDRCSACGQRVTRRATGCPQCHASFTATVSSDEDRLEAEESLDDAHVSEDDPPSGPASEEERLLAAIYAEWLFARGFVSDAFRARAPELFERARNGELGTAELAALADESLENETAKAFETEYFGARGVWADDYERLTTANRIRDTRAGHARVQTVWDHRFEEWQAARGKNEAARDG